MYLVTLAIMQGGITCGAIDEPRKSSKAIDERVIINFRDKNVVIARFRDKNVVIAGFRDKNGGLIQTSFLMIFNSDGEMHSKWEKYVSFFYC